MEKKKRNMNGEYREKGREMHVVVGSELTVITQHCFKEA